jgi:hypothetical protein
LLLTNHYETTYHLHFNAVFLLGCSKQQRAGSSALPFNVTPVLPLKQRNWMREKLFGWTGVVRGV